MSVSGICKHSAHPETILFVGAGATSSLSMPATQDQAGIIWYLCDAAELSAAAVEAVANSSHCFDGYGQFIADMLKVVDPGYRGDDMTGLSDEVCERAFPSIAKEQVSRIIPRLRRHYDWSALKLVASAKKGEVDRDKKPRDNYLQEVFTLIDACLRESRGFNVYHGNDLIFLSVERLRAARELLVLLINTMFACAWQKLIKHDEKISDYRKFFASLATMMQDEGVRLARQGALLSAEEFSRLSYSLITTNFEPIFLWLVWQGHLKANKGPEVRLGNPGRMLKLLMNFPSTVGMRKPADDGEDLSSDVWFPCTEAVAQNVNNGNYVSNRVFRVGCYSPVHGMSNIRHCPACGRTNLYLGDSWNANSDTLFVNGITAPLSWGQKPRTANESRARGRGEYDALECQFCGAMTYSYDNFMFMQTQLKCSAPSFIKEITDDALAQIAGAKHIVLLGYSMPLDDAIWGSLFTAMSRRPKGEHVYCTVAATYDKDGPDGWLAGDELRHYIAEIEKKADETEDGRWQYEKIRAIKNAITVFGEKYVRAYVRGVPNVFGEGTVEDVRRLMYPYDQPGWNIPEFTPCGVEREVRPA